MDKKNIKLQEESFNALEKLDEQSDLINNYLDILIKIKNNIKKEKFILQHDIDSYNERHFKLTCSYLPVNQILNYNNELGKQYNLSINKSINL
jgi:hypothetical protein